MRIGDAPMQDMLLVLLFYCVYVNIIWSSTRWPYRIACIRSTFSSEVSMVTPPKPLPILPGYVRVMERMWLRGDLLGYMVSVPMLTFVLFVAGFALIVAVPTVWSLEKLGLIKDSQEQVQTPTRDETTEQN